MDLIAESLIPKESLKAGDYADGKYKSRRYTIKIAFSCC
jgi:hypothetical protein